MKKKNNELQMRATETMRILRGVYPNLVTPLHHENVFQLLMAVMLSAQCTDELVNKVTPSLFKAFPDAHTLANADVADVARVIQRVNYYKTKARHLVAMGKMLVADFGGNVPDTMAGLVQLPGVGRKTANVILAEGFHRPEGVVVDTHVKRLANRLGLTKQDDPLKIEADLMKLVPEADWDQFSLALIYHGRACCTARNPNHTACPLAHLCPSAGK